MICLVVYCLILGVALIVIIEAIFTGNKSEIPLIIALLAAAILFGGLAYGLNSCFGPEMPIGIIS